MSRITAAIDALTSATNPATTLIAITITTRTEYPGGLATELDRAEQKHLRRLERAARVALRKPPPELYSVLPGPDWHIVLAPHASDERIYLSRARRQRHYEWKHHEAAPIAPPGTLIAQWQQQRATEHRFLHVSVDQEALLMHYATADRLIHIHPNAPRDGLAHVYTAITGPGAALGATPQP